MRPHNYKSEGIILARKNYGEADRILSVYSKDLGRVTLIAKGIRRPNSRKRGHLEIFNLIKFQAVSSHGFDIMTEAEVTDNYSEIRKSLKKVSLAYYFVEVTSKVTRELEPNQELFDLLQRYLEELKVSKKLKKLRFDFITEILTLLGFWPKDKELPDPDGQLEEVIERQVYSKRVGKKISED